MMTQTQIIQTMADKCEMPKKTAKAMMEALGQTAVTEVKKNGVFVLPGLGDSSKKSTARQGWDVIRQPAGPIKIAAKKVQ